jgi:hypothetical protein
MDAVTLLTTKNRSQPHMLLSTAEKRGCSPHRRSRREVGQPYSYPSNSLQVRDTMPQSVHDRAAELHNLAAHAHAAAAAAHGTGDHLTAHELTRRAHEHSVSAHEFALQLAVEAAGDHING